MVLGHHCTASSSSSMLLHKSGHNLVSCILSSSFVFPSNLMMRGFSWQEDVLWCWDSSPRVKCCGGFIVRTKYSEAEIYCFIECLLEKGTAREDMTSEMMETNGWAWDAAITSRIKKTFCLIDNDFGPDYDLRLLFWSPCRKPMDVSWDFNKLPLTDLLMRSQGITGQCNLNMQRLRCCHIGFVMELAGNFK